MPTPYTRMHVRLVGHRSLGVVNARWAGPYLELESGTRYGPCAVFETRVSDRKVSGWDGWSWQRVRAGWDGSAVCMVTSGGWTVWDPDSRKMLATGNESGAVGQWLADTAAQENGIELTPKWASLDGAREHDERVKRADSDDSIPF